MGLAMGLARVSGGGGGEVGPPHGHMLYYVGCPVHWLRLRLASMSMTHVPLQVSLLDLPLLANLRRLCVRESCKDPTLDPMP